MKSAAKFSIQMELHRHVVVARLQDSEGSSTMAYGFTGNFFPGLGGQIEIPQSNTVNDIKFLMTRTLNEILDLMPKPCVKYYILYTSA